MNAASIQRTVRKFHFLSWIWFKFMLEQMDIEMSLKDELFYMLWLLSNSYDFLSSNPTHSALMTRWKTMKKKMIQISIQGPEIQKWPYQHSNLTQQIPYTCVVDPDLWHTYLPNVWSLALILRTKNTEIN